MCPKRNPGSLGSEMRIRIKEHTKNKSKHTQRNYRNACSSFDIWRKEAGLLNSDVRKDPRAAIEQWRDSLQERGYSAGTIHTYIAGACCGMGIDMAGIAKQGTAADKRKSLGLSKRSQQARSRESNAEIVRFQELVGGRRAALQRLTGADLVKDESGEFCVRFIRDKGGKDQLQRIAPEDLQEVKAYFDAAAPGELLFPDEIDRDLDLHGIRAERAKREYARYAEICRTEDGRKELRSQLWRRYTDPRHGCKAYLMARQRGDTEAMRALRIRFSAEMADGKYYLQKANRKVALERGLPVGYDRLALCCVSVFALSHWRNEVTVKHYML